MKTYKYTVQGVDYEVEIAEVIGKIAKVNVNGIPFELEMQRPINTAKHPTMTPKRGVVTPAAPASDTVAPAAAAPAPAKSAPVAAGTGAQVKAPLPGTVTEVKVNVGDQVNAGDVLVVLEAMKMQNNIESEYTGKVTSVVVKPGETVMEGSVLLTIA